MDKIKKVGGEEGEAFFPDGTWCDRHFQTGTDFYCLDRKCQPINPIETVDATQTAAEKAARRWMRAANVRSRLLF
jgi:hypothetical protein